MNVLKMPLGRLGFVWFTISISTMMVGCGPREEYGVKGVQLRGRIVLEGQPLPLDRPDVGLGVVDLILVHESQNQPVDYASAREDGKFEFLGDGQGVPPGSYRLAVRHYKTGPGKDELAGKLNVANTSISVNVPQDRMGKTLDLGDIELSDHLQ
jgi:hypothetical protein